MEPPYAFVDTSGEATGEAPEILRHVAGELALDRVQWFPVPFHRLIPVLLAGRIDVIASGMFVTPERERQVEFSLPTACVQPVLVRPREDVTGSARRSSGAGCDGCRFAVLQGSVEQRALEEHGQPGAELLVLPDLSTATAALAQGTADALAISAPTARMVVGSDSSLALDRDGLPRAVSDDARGCAAFAFRPDDTELAEAFDSVLHDFLGSPAHLDVVRPFGFTRRELPCAEGAWPEPDARPGPCAGIEGEK